MAACLLRPTVFRTLGVASLSLKLIKYKVDVYAEMWKFIRNLEVIAEIRNCMDEKISKLFYILHMFT